MRADINRHVALAQKAEQRVDALLRHRFITFARMLPASSATVLTNTSGAAGTGNRTIGYGIAANTGAARSASISVNGASVNFSPSGAASIAPTGCAVTLSLTNVKVNSGGGSSDVTVTA